MVALEGMLPLHLGLAGSVQLAAVEKRMESCLGGLVVCSTQHSHVEVILVELSSEG